MREIKWNDKVSKKRGPEWKAKLVEGRLDAAINPSKIKMRRVKSRLSQSDVASEAELSLATYGAIERGRRMVKVKVADKLTKILRCKKEDLFKTLPKGKFIAKK
jgi:DNA-binding XRE family transcriptional regulator